MTDILVVDDEYAIREFIAVVLQDEGYHVALAGNGKEALDQLATIKADLMILDIMMPVLDGREVLRRIRADPTLEHLPVLVMSAAAVPSAIVDARIEGFLSKPFDLDNLTATVSTILRSRT